MMNRKTKFCFKNAVQPESLRPQAVLVCGVDVDASTALKVDNPIFGRLAILDFMEEFDSQLRNFDAKDGDDERDNWFLWRVQGDELIYFRIIPLDRKGRPDSLIITNYVKQFKNAVEGEYKVKVNSSDKVPLGLHGYAFLLHSDNWWDFSWNFISRKLLGKTGRQIEAGKVYDPDRYKIIEAIFSEYQNSLREIHEDYFIDFIGRDVDLGFRVAEYSRPHYFVPSPKLARYLLEGDKKGALGGNILFLGFHEMKGCSIGEGGPDRFPLYFLPIKNKGKSASDSILENYRILKIKKIEKKLKRFEDYEYESCKAKYNELLEYKEDKFSNLSNMDSMFEKIIQDIESKKLFQENGEEDKNSGNPSMEVLRQRMRVLEHRMEITQQRIEETMRRMNEMES